MRTRFVGYLEMPMLQMRRATEADTLALAELFLASRIQAFHWCAPTAFQLDDFVRQTEGEMVFLACEGDGKPLGFISVWEPDRFIHHLFVAPGQQGRGVGSLLLESLDSWLPRPYRLKCLLANSAALSFYLRRGWEEVERGEDAFGEYALMELR